MKNIRIKYWFLHGLLVIVLSITVLLSLTTRTKEVSPNKDIMEQATLKTQECFDTILQYKLSHNIEIPEYDILQTGMIGLKKRTSITTTEGVLEAKRTSTNPNWAAVIVSYFEKAKLSIGDEVGIVCSGSFPCMNIASVCACEAFGLNYCLMISVGASYYGANDPYFTNLEIFKILYNNNLISKLQDIISLGGGGDCGLDFRNEQEKSDILDRISNSGIEFLYEENYEENINKRINIFKEKVPNMKLLISCGGSIVAMGKENQQFIENGYFEGDSYYNYQKNENTGLVGYYKSMGMPIASLINIKYLALQYNIPVDPSETPIKGVGSECSAYYVISYKKYIPIIGLSFSSLLLVFIFIYRKKHEKDFINIKDKSFN